MRRLTRGLVRYIKGVLVAVFEPFIAMIVAQYTRQAVQLLRPFTSNHTLIRFGDDGDGGYLVPEDLDGIDAVFSPGVAEQASFEAEFVSRGVRCFLIDASIDGAPESSPLIDFEPLFLGARDGDSFTTLETWVNRKVGPDASELLLQMDIEGAEWKVLENIDPSLLARFRIIALELHRTAARNRLRHMHRVVRCIRNLTATHTVVHIHPNNDVGEVHAGGMEVPVLLEVTLLRNDRISTAEPTRSFPHPLDRTNVPRKPDIVLPKCWYDYD